ncbi:MAG: hypothetical protein ACKOAU_03120, partial [Pirellula sp.]
LNMPPVRLNVPSETLSNYPQRGLSGGSMDADQWKLASLQAIEHLSKLGVRYLPKPHSNLQEVLEDWSSVAWPSASNKSAPSTAPISRPNPSQASAPRPL